LYNQMQLDHIQVAAPPGCEAEARRRFHCADPFGNRLEFLE
jgi:hypothetical protein